MGSHRLLQKRLYWSRKYTVLTISQSMCSNLTAEVTEQPTFHHQGKQEQEGCAVETKTNYWSCSKIFVKVWMSKQISQRVNRRFCPKERLQSNNMQSQNYSPRGLKNFVPCISPRFIFTFKISQGDSTLIVKKLQEDGGAEILHLFKTSPKDHELPGLFWQLFLVAYLDCDHNLCWIPRRWYQMKQLYCKYPNASKKVLYCLNELILLILHWNQGKKWTIKTSTTDMHINNIADLKSLETQRWNQYLCLCF